MPDGAPIGPGVFGPPTLRIDGRLKVTGQAAYPSDEPVREPAYAWLVTSAIARGRVTGFHLEEAKAVPGVLDILTHENVGGLAKPPPPPGGKGKETTTTLESDRVWHDGQIVAIVIAETRETAREAAHKVRIDYSSETPSATFGSQGATTIALAEADKGGGGTPQQGHQDPKVGDAESAFAAAAVKVDGHYGTPTQHHNPIELFTTTCEWRDGKLTIHESSQFVHGLQNGVAKQLGIDPGQVRVISRFIGGAFGSRGGLTSRTAWIAIAARRLNRPVRLEATRDQGFTIVTYRAETRHHVRLGAGRDGMLQAVLHEAWEATSRPSTYNVSGTETTSRLYGSPNVWTKVSVVQLDRNTPGFMRAPPETPYLFALESAMDELAYALSMDPVALRTLNDTPREPIDGKPYTSRHLVECLDAAAQAFGWSRRNPKPGSMRDGDWLIGLGCAAATYPANISAAAARVSLSPDGAAKVEIGAHDLGTGSYTVIAEVAADRLGVPVDKIEVRIGDSELPAAGLSAGSNHASAICNVVAKACEEVRAKVAAAAAAAADSPLHGSDPGSLRLVDGRLRAPDGRAEPLGNAAGRAGGRIEVYAENLPEGVPKEGIAKIYAGQMASARGSEMPHDIRHSFGAQFAEVRVHRLTREVRVKRLTGAFAAGTIINPITARSQLMGGMIWGASAALLEATEIDLGRARYVNDDLAEYLMAVNADVPEVEVIMIPETDPKLNALGMKGVGELGITGMNAAVANAVFHATGVRIRELPIRIEKLL